MIKKGLGAKYSRNALRPYIKQPTQNRFFRNYNFINFLMLKTEPSVAYSFKEYIPFGNSVIEILFSFLFVFLVFKVSAQAQQYTTSNAHSHNDYENVAPFELAYSKGFGSIEADIFLQNDTLFVGHDLQEIKRQIRVIHDYWQMCKHPNTT